MKSETLTQKEKSTISKSINFICKIMAKICISKLCPNIDLKHELRHFSLISNTGWTSFNYQRDEALKWDLDFEVVFQRWAIKDHSDQVNFPTTNNVE